MTASVFIHSAPLAELGRALLVAAGATPGHARIVVDHLIEADRMGLKSHGMMRVPQYVEDMAKGGIDPAAVPKFVHTAPGRAACDGGKGFGQVVGHAMADEAVRLARSAGIAFVTGRHMGHTGRIGAYPEAMAAAGMVGIAVCSGPRSGHWVAPFGGREGRISTNPIAYAFPVEGGPPVVADFSTSVVPEGVVRSLKFRGLPTPPGALRDNAGRETNDPADLYADPRGAIQPLGGAFGYRGTALAMLVEVLAAFLAEDETDDMAREGSNLAMIAIAAGAGFAGRAMRMSAYLKTSPPLDRARPVLMPGEREQAAAAALGNAPIPVDGPTWTALTALAARNRVALPEPAATA